jgi:hypothetical protein
MIIKLTPSIFEKSIMKGMEKHSKTDSLEKYENDENEPVLQLVSKVISQEEIYEVEEATTFELIEE